MGDQGQTRMVQGHVEGMEGWVEGSEEGSMDLVPDFADPLSSTINQLEWGMMMAVLEKKKAGLSIDEDMADGKSGSQTQKGGCVDREVSLCARKCGVRLGEGVVVVELAAKIVESLIDELKDISQ